MKTRFDNKIWRKHVYTIENQIRKYILEKTFLKHGFENVIGKPAILMFQNMFFIRYDMEATNICTNMLLKDMWPAVPFKGAQPHMTLGLKLWEAQPSNLGGSTINSFFSFNSYTSFFSFVSLSQVRFKISLGSSLQNY